MDMSYSKAWKLVCMVEKRLWFTILNTKIGGLSGGGPHVTLEGKDFLRRYERFESDAKKVIEKTCQKFLEIDH
jgi:molybdate transport repressor ModE-like protein